MDLSIIIVNWKSAGVLADCLASLARNPPTVTWECTVIDNASFDGSEKLCADRFPYAKFIQSGENLGFAGANNRAAQQAAGSALLFLNPDTVACPGSLQALYTGLMDNPRAGAAGPCLRNSDGSLQTTGVLPEPTIIRDIFDSDLLQRATRFIPTRTNRALYGRAAGPRPVEALSGAALMVRRSVFDKVGGFSKDYFMYGEDIDLCMKIRRAGLLVTYVQESEIVHLGGASSKKSSRLYFQSVMIKESNRILLNKFKGAGYASLYCFAMGMSAVVRLLLLYATLVQVFAAKRSTVGKWRAILRWSAGDRLYVVSPKTGGPA